MSVVGGEEKFRGVPKWETAVLCAVHERFHMRQSGGMNVYVVGAGLSKCVGYPTGPELFDCIDKYVRTIGNLIDRFDYRQDWDEFRGWLAENTDPAVAQAYSTKNVEHLFTALDLVFELRNSALSSVAAAVRNEEALEKRAQEFETFDAKIQQYQRYRNLLLWALEHYFAWRHSNDCQASTSKEWKDLDAFGNRLERGDVIITFNYDAVLERVLRTQQKWSPSDGYGFKVVFQKSRYDKTREELPDSQITILHLHGATGWYRRPTFDPDYVLPPGPGGPISREAFGAAPMETKISLDPSFLSGLEISSVDACLPDLASVSDERHVVLHPSFLKDYEGDDSDSQVLPSLWKRAAEALRDASHTYIIGYSLPKADVAALTLLLTNVKSRTTTIVNPDQKVLLRLGGLFSVSRLAPSQTLQDWLTKT